MPSGPRSVARLSCILVQFLFGIAPPTAYAQDVIHLEGAAEWNNNPASDAKMTARLNRAAVEYRKHAPIPRIAMFDIGYPLDSAEYRSLHGFAAIMVTTVSQDSAELPLARLFFRASTGRETNLASVVQSCGRLLPSDSIIRDTFGKYRCDALYLFPVTFGATPGELLADFAIRRFGFRLAQFGEAIPPALRKLPLGPPGSPPLLGDALPFVNREFPAFARLLHPK